LQDIGLFAVTESQCTEDEHDDEDDAKFRNLGLNVLQRRVAGNAYEPKSCKQLTLQREDFRATAIDLQLIPS
jgi:hypothetical protein